MTTSRREFLIRGGAAITVAATTKALVTLGLFEVTFSLCEDSRVPDSCRRA